MVLIDDYSRYLVLYLLKDKAEAKECIKSYVRLVENQFKWKPQIIRSDRGAEFVNKEHQQFYRDEGIEMQLTAGYSPQQNGVAERRHRYLQEMAVCMLLDAGLEKRYWGEAIAAAAYIQNRLPSRVVQKTLMELWCGVKPDLSHLKVFGCSAYVYVPDVKRSKLQSRAEKLIFVGYACESKAYRFLNKRTGKIIISRDVKFLELGAELQEESEGSPKKRAEAKDEVSTQQDGAVSSEVLVEFQCSGAEDGSEDSDQVSIHDSNVVSDNDDEPDFRGRIPRSRSLGRFVSW